MMNLRQGASETRPSVRRKLPEMIHYVTSPGSLLDVLWITLKQT